MNYMSYMPYVWVGVMVLMAVLEGITTQLVSVWFVLGALAAAIVSFFVPVFPIQFLIFVVVSMLLLIFTRPLVKKAKTVHAEPTNADRNIGKTAVVTQEINNLAGTGQVKLGGNTWTARAADEEVIAVGVNVIVKEISGVKLMVSTK